MAKKKDVVELNLRLPAEGWKDLTGLLMALLGGAPAAGGGVQRGAAENPAFDERVFWQLAQAERAGEGVPAGIETAEEAVEIRRMRGSVDTPLSVPAPVGYDMEEAKPASFQTSPELPHNAAEQTEAAEDWERRWERDCRRYDSGFPIR